MKTNYTDTQLQAAIDEACDKLAQSTRVYLNALDLANTTESWPVEAPARLDLIKSALATLPEPMDEESMLLNLLAVIHRDGGHYQAEHGTRKAVEDACKEWQRLISIVEKTGLTEPKQSLSQLRPLSEAGAVPEGCIRVRGWEDTDRWYYGWTEWEGDTHFADIRLPEASLSPATEAAEPATEAAEPETFEAHGRTWTRHTPGDVMPCDGQALIHCLMGGNLGRHFGTTLIKASCVRWTAVNPDSDIIGWRYDDEPTPEPTSTKPISLTSWTPAVGDVVTLKSGGPKMTVMQDIGHKLLCAYDSLGEVKTVLISTNCLQPA